MEVGYRRWDTMGYPRWDLHGSNPTPGSDNCSLGGVAVRLHAIDATPHRSLRAQEGKEHRIAGVTTVGELRDEAAKACGLATCRLVYKGDLTKDPSQKLEDTKLRPGAKCLVMRARR